MPVSVDILVGIEKYPSSGCLPFFSVTGAPHATCQSAGNLWANTSKFYRRFFCSALVSRES